MSARNFNIPNSISTLRIISVPLLLLLAFKGARTAFTFVLAASLVMDILDGFLARRLNQQTRLGAQLDSWGDLLTVVAYCIAAFWLRPLALRHNAIYVEVAAAAYVCPILFGFMKFGRLTSYHTRLATVAAYLMGVAVIAFFAGWSELPLRLACVVLLASQIEEIAITATLASWHANVRDLHHARQIRQRDGQTRALAGERSRIN